MLKIISKSNKYKLKKLFINEMLMNQDIIHNNKTNFIIYSNDKNIKSKLFNNEYPHDSKEYKGNIFEMKYKGIKIRIKQRDLDAGSYYNIKKIVTLKSIKKTLV